jgi:hypothetical protein
MLDTNVSNIQQLDSLAFHDCIKNQVDPILTHSRCQDRMSSRYNSVVPSIRLEGSFNDDDLPPSTTLIINVSFT